MVEYPFEGQQQIPVAPKARLVEALRSQLPKDGTLQMKLLSLLQELDERLTAAGVTYWITGGTLLGAMRHQGFIPHDDDVDIEILEAELPQAMEALGNVGRSFRDGGHWQGSTVRMGRFFWWNDDKRFTCCVDVFLREASLDEMDEFPSHAEVYPLERVPFHNITVMAPNSRGADTFLSRCYSPSWSHEVVVWTHNTRSREMLRVSLADYSAAVRASDYTTPVAAGTAGESLQAVMLSCPGELNEELWRDFGWASPLPLTCDGVDAYDPAVLEMLGLSTRAWPIGGCVVTAEWLSASGELQKLQSQTGANVTVLGEEHLELRAVGSEEEIAKVEAALGSADWWTTAPIPVTC